MSSSLLAAAVNVQRWLVEDAQKPFDERLTRDRAIGLKISAKKPELPAHRKVLQWWACVCAKSDTPSEGDRLVALRRFAAMILTVLGVLLGMALSTVAFGYEGAYPVNLFALLGVLVGIPTLMLVTTLLLLPGRIPGLSHLQSSFSGINPARWAGGLLDRLGGIQLFGTFPPRRPMDRDFARWQLLVFSQWFAVGYFFGVVLVAGMLVAVTDLAFGWSTTLELDSQRVSGWFHAVSLPWSTWLPVATPDSGLVEASRFYRLESPDIPAERAAELGRWWPFVIMTILTYGLAPRVVLLAFGQWRVGLSVRRLLERGPEVSALLDRLAAPAVSYAAESEDVESVNSKPVPSLPDLQMDATSQILIWNDALEPQAAVAWAGGFATDLSEPVAVAAWQSQTQRSLALSAMRSDPHRIVVFTKGWEPPLLAFLDFLTELADSVGSPVTLIIVPVDVTGNSVKAPDREVWAKALAGFTDAHLYVVDAT